MRHWRAWECGPHCHGGSPGPKPCPPSFRDVASPPWKPPSVGFLLPCPHLFLSKGRALGVENPCIQSFSCHVCAQEPWLSPSASLRLFLLSGVGVPPPSCLPQAVLRFLAFGPWASTCLGFSGRALAITFLLLSVSPFPSFRLAGAGPGSWPICQTHPNQSVCSP